MRISGWDLLEKNRHSSEGWNPVLSWFPDPDQNGFQPSLE
jgi:hypothetical protein